nr:MAG: capsid protein [Cressdnaviricota sp.]
MAYYPKRYAFRRRSYTPRRYGGYSRAAPARRYARKRVAYRRRAVTRRASVASPGIQPGTGGAPKFLCAQINPFDRGVVGVRVPDDSTAPSSSFYVFDETSITTTAATKNNAKMYMPALNAFAANATEGNSLVTWGSDMNASTSATQKYAAIQAQYSLFRPVAHAVRLTCSGAPTTQTGYVHYCLLPLSTFAVTSGAWKAPTTVSDMTTLPGYSRATLASLTQTPLIIVNRWMDQTAFRYIDVKAHEWNNDTTGATGGMFETMMQWMAIIVMVEGAVANSGIQVESILHCEGQSLFSGLSRDIDAEPGDRVVFDGVSEALGNASSSMPDSPQGMMSRVSEVTQGFCESVMRVGGEAGKQLVYSVVKSFGTNIGKSAARGAVAAGIAGVNMYQGRVR